MCVGLCPPGPIVKAPKDGEVSSQIIGTAPSWPQRRPSYQHSPAVLRPPRLPSLLGHRQGPSQLSLSRAHGLQVLPPSYWGGRGSAQAHEADTGEVHGSVQIPGVLLATDEKSSGTRGVQTAHRCVFPRTHLSSRGTFPPHLREEGPLSKTVYLPTCHVFAKTMILKDMSPSSVGPGRGAAFWVGCAPPASVPLGAPQRPVLGRLCFPSL